MCRHRGSRLLEEPCGSVGNLVCPYHQWTYRTDGSLIYAEGQSPSFDKTQFGLKQVHVRTVAGLIFVCLAEEPPADFDEVAAVLEPYLRRTASRRRRSRTRPTSSRRATGSSSWRTTASATTATPPTRS